MRGKDDLRRLPWSAGIHIEALAGGAAFLVLFHGYLLDRISLGRQKLRQKCAHRAFVVGDGLDVDKAPRELNRIQRHAQPEYLPVVFVQ